MPRELNFALTYKQLQFVKCDEPRTLYLGGIGAGKTWAGCVKVLKYCNTKSVIVVCAPTYTMLRDVVVRTMQEVAGPLWSDFNKGDMTVHIGASDILFRSTDQPDRLRGINADAAYIDEACLCDEDTWPIILGRLRARGKLAPVWLTTTPKGKGNWVYRNLGSMKVFESPTKENIFLAPEYIQSLEQNYVGEFARQELEAVWVSFEGLVYAEFNPKVHVLPIDAEIRRTIKYWVMGIDEGYTCPAAALLLGVDGDDRVYVAEEFYQRQVLQSAFVSYVKLQHSVYGLRGIYCDPSAAGLIAEMRAVGLPVIETDNKVADGIQKVKSRFPIQKDGKPRIFFDPGCVNTLHECDSYIWKPDRPKDEPVKQNDHALDALRYGIVGMGRTHGIYL